MDESPFSAVWSSPPWRTCPVRRSSHLRGKHVPTTWAPVRREGLRPTEDLGDVTRSHPTGQGAQPAAGNGPASSSGGPTPLAGGKAADPRPLTVPLRWRRHRPRHRAMPGGLGLEGLGVLIACEGRYWPDRAMRGASWARRSPRHPRHEAPPSSLPATIQDSSVETPLPTRNEYRP